MSESKLIPLTDLASPAQPLPSNPMRWDNEPVAEGVFLGVTDNDSALDLLGTPPLALPEAPRLPEDFAPSAALRSWLAELLLALEAAAAGKAARRLELDALNADDRIAVAQILGEGEVDGSVHFDGAAYEIREATLNGVWQITGDDGSEHVEVGRIPQVIAAAAASLRAAPLRVPEPQEGVMNAPALLSEISDRAARRASADPTGSANQAELRSAADPTGSAREAELRSAADPVGSANDAHSASADPLGSANHIINFTLLPTTEGDQALLLEVLGRADLRLRSGGFGDCHILATQVRHVWAVQYVNAMDHTILDTIEIGDIPAAALAAREDFEDSAARLRDITEAYLK